VTIRPLQDNLSQMNGYNFTKFTTRMPAGSKPIDLKKAIHQQWKLHPKQQRLTCDGVLTDDQKLLSEYGITSSDPVLVELILASIQLFVVGLGGIRVEVNKDLNNELFYLRTAAFGDAKCSTIDQVKLIFQDRELDWGHQLRTVQGLEDGSELHVSPLPRITLTIAAAGGEATIPDVDLNLTVLQFKEKYLNSSDRRNGDTRIARVVAELKKEGMRLCFETALDWNTPLRTIANLNEETPLTLIKYVDGGHHTA